MRPHVDSYFMEMAKVAATRSTCDRKHVGAVIVVNGSVVSTGYNGAPRGLPHCDDVGHDLVEFVVGHSEDNDGVTRPHLKESCVRTVHAEANAIASAARRGVSVEGGTIYTTASTCTDCAKLIINAGLRRVFALEKYMSRYGKSGEVEEMFHLADIQHCLGISPPAPIAVDLHGNF
jgi:dCMP deaminase